LLSPRILQNPGELPRQTERFLKLPQRQQPRIAGQPTGRRLDNNRLGTKKTE
jgi:hypothetical protein